MIKWFVYIVFLLVFAPCLLSAKTKRSRREYAIAWQHGVVFSRPATIGFTDTVKTLKSSKTDTKVKEVAKAKKQPKPEKVEDDDKKAKTGRQRRPDGLVRPPEIPRRNDN